MPNEIGGKKLVGDLGGIFDQIKATIAEARLGVAAAASELMTEVQGMKGVEKAIRAETASVREFNTKILGNAVGGENDEDETTKTTPTHEGERG